MFVILLGFQYILDLIKKQNNKIDNLAGSLATFETIDNVKDRIKKANDKNKKFTEDEIGKLNNKMKDLEMNTSKKLNTF
jgi:gas vesicle protein